MAESRSECNARVRRAAEVRRKEVFRLRNEEVRSISNDWRAGFAILKEENDRRQAANKAFVSEQLAEIAEDLRADLGACSLL